MDEKPTSVRDDLLIVDDLMLLLMDDDGVSIQTAGTLHDALGGAVLTELALLGRIQTDNSGVLDGPRVTQSGEGPLPDPLLQSAYDTVAEKPQRVRPLLVALGTDLWWVVLDRLVDRGLLHREATQLRARIRRVLADGEAADPRTAAIIGLLFASGAVPSLRPPLPWTSATVSRPSEIGRGHWGSEAHHLSAVTRTAAAIVAVSAACQRGDYDEVSARPAKGTLHDRPGTRRSRSEQPRYGPASPAAARALDRLRRPAGTRGRGRSGCCTSRVPDVRPRGVHDVHYGSSTVWPTHDLPPPRPWAQIY